MAKRTKKAETAAEIDLSSPPGGEEASAARPVLMLDEILGQDAAIGVLRAAISSRRVHHAWIFHGPPGVGKFTTAVAFAATVLDPTTAPDLSGVPRPDPESPVQRMIRAGTHPDLHVITKELARFSDDPQVRERKLTTIPKDVVEKHLLEPAVRAPAHRTDAPVKKVFIVDEAELLDRSLSNAPVQNALLKTLEEPPEGTVIILVTSSEDRLLPTIRSRCQRVAFTPLDERTLRLWYERAGMPSDAGQRAWLLDYAAGSPGWILSAVENDLYGWERELGPLLDQLESGRPAPELGAAMARLVDERAAAAVKKQPDASKEAANAQWLRRMFSMLAERYRRALYTGDERKRGVALEAIEFIVAAEGQAASNVTAAFVLENLAAQLHMAALGAAR